MSITFRYYTNTSINNDKLLLKIFARIVVLARQPGITIKRLTFIGRTLGNRAMLEAILGEQNAKLVGKGLQVPEVNIPIAYASKDKFFPIEEEVLVTLGLDGNEILKIEEEARSIAIIAIPFINDEAEKWARVTEATSIDTQLTASKFDEPTCIVKQALFGLDTINKDGSTLHDSDKNRVATYFRTLLDYNIQLNEDEVESYLFKPMGWRKTTIDLVLDVYRALKAGKRVQYKALEKSSYFYNLWDAKCK